MQISKIKLENFKKFKSNTFTFENGINIIKGNNEHGKSTILTAIAAALFIDPSSNRYKEKFKSWGVTEYPYLTINLLDDEGNDYELSKNFNTKEAILRFNNNEEKNYTLICKKIKDLTGFSNENIFKYTSCIRNGEISDIESGKKTLQESLQEICIGGKINLINLLKNIKNKSDELQIGLYHPAKNNGPIKMLKDMIEDKESELNEMKNKEKTIGVSSEKLENLNKELLTVEEDIKKYTKYVNDYEQWESLEKEKIHIDELIKNSESDIERIKIISDRLSDVNKKFVSLGGEDVLNSINRNSEKISANTQNLQSLQSDLTILKSTLEDEKINKKSSDKNSIILIFISILSLIFILIGIFLINFVLYLGIILEIVYLIYYFYTKEKNSKKNNDLEVEINNIDQKEREINIINNNIISILNEVGTHNLNEFFEKKTHLVALFAEINQLNTTISDLLNERKIEEIESELSVNKNKQVKIKDDMLTFDEIMNKDKYLRDKRELELLALDKADIIREITEEKTKIKIEDISPSIIIEKENNLSNLKLEMNNHLKHIKVLNSIYNALSSAKEDVSLEVINMLNGRINYYLKILTMNRYTDIKIDNSFSIKIYSSEKNDWFNPKDELSAGTIDQIYISARLALTEILSGNRKTPIFFDDPFLTFDSERRESLINNLVALSEKHQIFIFTCHNFFDKYGKILEI